MWLSVLKSSVSSVRRAGAVDCGSQQPFFVSKRKEQKTYGCRESDWKYPVPEAKVPADDARKVPKRSELLYRSTLSAALSNRRN